jgi:hypothetical protein
MENQNDEYNDEINDVPIEKEQLPKSGRHVRSEKQKEAFLKARLKRSALSKERQEKLNKVNQEIENKKVSKHGRRKDNIVEIKEDEKDKEDKKDKEDEKDKEEDKKDLAMEKPKKKTTKKKIIYVEEEDDGDDDDDEFENKIIETIIKEKPKPKPKKEPVEKKPRKQRTTGLNQNTQYMDKNIPIGFH